MDWPTSVRTVNPVLLDRCGPAVPNLPPIPALVNSITRTDIEKARDQVRPARYSLGKSSAPNVRATKPKTQPLRKKRRRGTIEPKWSLKFGTGLLTNFLPILGWTVLVSW
jgi:hypothetical protein